MEQTQLLRHICQHKLCGSGSKHCFSGSPGDLASGAAWKGIGVLGSIATAEAGAQPESVEIMAPLSLILAHRGAALARALFH